MKSHPIQLCQQEISRVIHLDQLTLDLLVLPIICGGHALIHGMIGTAKTLTIMALAKTLGLRFGVYQCHPETMPSDLLGFELFNQHTKEFEIREGPIQKYQLLLVDEINRMSPKPQAALLGPTAQGIVTIGVHKRELEQPFVLYATQNPIENQGVFPLSEAQIDRFLIQIPFPYHSYDATKHIMSFKNANDTKKKIEGLKEIMTKQEVMQAREALESIEAGDMWKLITAIHLLCCPRRNLGNRAPEGWKIHETTDICVLYGPSPRALIDLAQVAKGMAYLRSAREGREDVYVTKDDVLNSAVPVLRHRLIMNRMLPPEYHDLPEQDRADYYIQNFVLDEASKRSENLRDPVMQ